MSTITTCPIEVDSPLFFIEETIDYEGAIRTHGYWDESEAKADFEDFRNDPTVIAATLYLNTDDGPCALDVFSHRKAYVQAEFVCTFTAKPLENLFVSWLTDNHIDFCQVTADGRDEIHVYCTTDWEENATADWMNSHRAV